MLPILPLENELLFNKSEGQVQTLITLVLYGLNCLTANEGSKENQFTIKTADIKEVSKQCFILNHELLLHMTESVCSF